MGRSALQLHEHSFQMEEAFRIGQSCQRNRYREIGSRSQIAQFGY